MHKAQSRESLHEQPRLPPSKPVSLQRSLSRGKQKESQQSLFPPVKGQTQEPPEDLQSKALMEDLKRRQTELQKNLEIMLRF